MNAEPLLYWMRERHAIWVRRNVEGRPWPWTDDPILREYRFCNVFRELDTVTQWIHRHWRLPYADHPNLWFAMAVARQINWPETLEAITFPDAGSKTSMDAWFLWAKKIMWERQALGRKVYTGAYMLRGDIWRDHSKLNDKPTYTIDTVLRNVWNAEPGFHLRLAENPTLQGVHSWFMKWPGWGGFLSYEVVTDLRHTRYLHQAPDIMTWANAGPGAVRGLNRLYGRPLDKHIPQAQANSEMQWLLAIAKDALGPTFPALEMRDIEHSLCETDKYLRVQLGEGRPRSRYSPPRP